MPNGNNTGRGLETRQVINTPGPSGRANQPARQLGQLGQASIRPPRGGNVSNVGNSMRVLADIVKMGGEEFEGYLKQKQAKDEVTGEMLEKQGKTEQELRAAGYNQSVLKGFQTMKLKTGYSEWFAKMSHDAVNTHAGTSPEQFRNEVLGPQFDEVLNGLNPNDDVARELFTEFGREGFSKLVERHTIAHTQYLDSDSITTMSNMLYADASTGDIEMVRESLSNFDTMTTGMSEAGKQKAMLDAMIPQLTEGNFLIYDELGGAQGLRDAGYSTSQVQSVQRAVEQAQVVRENSTDAEFNNAIDSIRIRSKQGRIGPEEALEEAQALQTQYRTSDEWVRGIVRGVRQEDFDRQLQDHELSILHDPDYTQAMAQLAILADQQGNTPVTTNAVLHIAEKFDLPRDMVIDNLELIRAAQDRKITKDINKVQRNNELLEKERTKDLKAQSAIQSDSIHTLDKDTQQRAMDMKRQQITQSIQEPSEQIEAHVDFLRTTPVVDQFVKANFTEASSVSPIGSNGELTPEAEDSLSYFLAMRQAGLSENTIRKYAGDGYDYMNTAAFLQNGSLDVSKSLLGAYEVTQTKTEQRETPRTQVQAIRKQVNKDIDSFFDDIEPSMFASWTGAASDAKYDEVLTYEVREAAKNSDDMRAWALDRAENYSAIYPDMRPDAVSSLVKQDLGRWEYVFGKMVPPKNGQSLSEMMGIEDLPEALSTNSAVLHTLHSRMDTLAPPGSDTRGVLDRFFDNLGDEALEAVLAPEKFLHSSVTSKRPSLKDDQFERGEGTFLSNLGQAVLAPINAIEARQRILKDLVPVDVTPYGNGVVLLTLYHDADKTEPIGTPIPLDAEVIGADYRNRLK